MSYYVYLVTNQTGKHTYVGYTSNPQRRLRQHNRELKGGARSTARFHGSCEFAILIGPFESKRLALSIEWSWKHKKPSMDDRKRMHSLRRPTGIQANLAQRAERIAWLLRHPTSKMIELNGGTWDYDKINIQCFRAGLVVIFANN